MSARSRIVGPGSEPCRSATTDVVDVPVRISRPNPSSAVEDLRLRARQVEAELRLGVDAAPEGDRVGQHGRRGLEELLHRRTLRPGPEPITDGGPERVPVLGVRRHAVDHPATTPGRAPRGARDRRGDASAPPRPLRTRARDRRRSARSGVHSRVSTPCNTVRARGPLLGIEQVGQRAHARPASVSRPTTRTACRRRSRRRPGPSRAAGSPDAPRVRRALRRSEAAASRRATRRGRWRRAPTPDRAHPPRSVPRDRLRVQAPVLHPLPGSDRAGELVDAVAPVQLAAVDHATQGHAGGALGDPEHGAPAHQAGAGQAGRVHAEQQARDHRASRERPGQQRLAITFRRHLSKECNIGSWPC